MKIFDLIKIARTENKVLEAEILLSFFLDKPRSFLIANNDLEVSNEILNKFNEAFEKILSGYPINYIINKKEFFGREFYVDDRVLIPRPETECLIENVLAYRRDMPWHVSTMQIFDVGTGSGCIGITLALELIEKYGFNNKNLNVILSDISEDALEVAKINVEKFKLEESCEVVRGDLMESYQLPATSRKPKADSPSFTILVANLPYIGLSSNNFVQGSVKEYEPNLALFSGEDGLDLYRKLLDQVALYKPDFACFEFGMGQEGEFEKLIKEKLPGYKYSFYKDLGGVVRGCILEILI